MEIIAVTIDLTTIYENSRFPQLFSYIRWFFHIYSDFPLIFSYIPPHFIFPYIWNHITIIFNWVSKKFRKVKIFSKGPKPWVGVVRSLWFYHQSKEHAILIQNRCPIFFLGPPSSEVDRFEKSWCSKQEISYSKSL